VPGVSGLAQYRHAPVSNETIGAQITALANWEQGTSPVGLTNVDKPVLVRQRRRRHHAADDWLVPPRPVAARHTQLSIYPDSGHGGIFQHHDMFVAQALDFLRD
jgi:pimeloyl-ACP methyl ester carboxylesterase